MRTRNLVLWGAAAGVAAGALGWYVARRAVPVPEAEPIQVGDPFPALTGTTLAGDRVTVPDDLAGRVGLLIVAFDYAARFEVTAWARHATQLYGEQPELAIYQVAMISGVGPLMRRVIDRAMVRQTPAWEHSQVLTVYGDLRWARRRLASGAERQARAFLLDRDGTVLWLATGMPDDAGRAALDAALNTREITVAWKPA